MQSDEVHGSSWDVKCWTNLYSNIYVKHFFLVLATPSDYGSSGRKMESKIP
jgi:hypothetical protein